MTDDQEDSLRCLTLSTVPNHYEVNHAPASLPVDPESAEGRPKELLDAVRASLGAMPNMAATMARSSGLDDWLGLSRALRRGSIAAANGERIALGVAEANECAYCLSVHSYLSANVVGLERDEIERARHFESTDPKAAELLAFAAAVVRTKGGVSDGDIEAAREAGLFDAELSDVVGHVAVNVLTNYFNRAFEVEVDFPRVEPHGSCRSADRMWLEAIWRYPVKSTGGRAPRRRRSSVRGRARRPRGLRRGRARRDVSARTRPRLLGLRGGTRRRRRGRRSTASPWDGRRRSTLVSRRGGPSARLVPAERVRALRHPAAARRHRRRGREAGLDVRRLRPNLVIGGVEGLAERAWEGRFLRIGDAVIGLATCAGRCIVTTYEPDTLEQDIGVLLELRSAFAGTLALNAWTARPATVRVGDPVELLDSFSEAEMPGLGRFVAGRP